MEITIPRLFLKLNQLIYAKYLGHTVSAISVYFSHNKYRKGIWSQETYIFKVKGQDIQMPTTKTNK
jgi:hypothetical protein